MLIRTRAAALLGLVPNDFADHPLDRVVEAFSDGDQITAAKVPDGGEQQISIPEDSVGEADVAGRRGESPKGP